MGQVTYIGYGALQAKAMAALTAGVAQGAEYLAGQQQAAAPKDTGTLAASIHVEGPVVGGMAVTARTVTGGEASDYAIPQHEGSAPHDIHPSSAQALAWPGGAHPVRVVHHPGNPPTKYMEGPLLEARPLLREFLARAARGVF